MSDEIQRNHTVSFAQETFRLGEEFLKLAKIFPSGENQLLAIETGEKLIEIAGRFDSLLYRSKT